MAEAKDYQVATVTSAPAHYEEAGGDYMLGDEEKTGLRMPMNRKNEVEA